MLTTATKKLVERVEVETPFNFGGLVAAFERQLGHYDKAIGEELVRRHASWAEVTAAMDRISGPHGLMIMAHLELGRTVSLTGSLVECSLYLVGNPLIISEITDVKAGMLVPFRVELYADAGKSVISYDRPSSSLDTLDNRALDALGSSLDAKMQSLIGALASPVDTTVK
ncbi:DUF302 domain-containing protein [Bradyrhizobium sp. LA2.1]|uniref:DUF302 domain-containing protein n=1 Tax=Bradyrhizobium sp. LA2.1 TaxID=3156376 RepID=UPI0033965484